MLNQVRSIVLGAIAITLYTFGVLHGRNTGTQPQDSAPSWLSSAVLERSGGDFRRKGAGNMDNEGYPGLFIYRRSNQTGSASMSNALLTALQGLGYEPVQSQGESMEIVVRNEFVKHAPRRLLVLSQNAITRAAHPRGKVVIADTFSYGFAQVTSQCRHMIYNGSCGDAVVRCMRAEPMKSLVRYRFADNEEEDEDTYVDLPLSALHPALSTTVLRTVYPQIRIDIGVPDIENAACAETLRLREVYDKVYGELERQMDSLKMRMLVIAGYPVEVAGRRGRNFTLDDMLEAAERKELEKYPYLL